MMKNAFWCIISILFYFISNPSAQARPDLVVIPFKTYKGMIIVQGKIDNHLGNLLIDTGIRRTIINGRYLKNTYEHKEKGYGGFQSINGIDENTSLSSSIIKLEDFSMNIIAHVIDLHPVEKQKSLNILGIVGIEVFLKYELVIDYFSSEILLFRLDKKGNRIIQEPQPPPVHTTPLHTSGKRPYILTELNGTRFNLVLDTGAEINLLASEFYEQFRDQFTDVQTTKTIDLNGKQQTSFSAQTNGLVAGTIELPPMTTLFLPLSNYYGKLGVGKKDIHGLLGYEFFQHFRTAMNFKKRECYLWDEEALNYGPVSTMKN